MMELLKERFPQSSEKDRARYLHDLRVYAQNKNTKNGMEYMVRSILSFYKMRGDKIPQETYENLNNIILNYEKNYRLDQSSDNKLKNEEKYYQDRESGKIAIREGQTLEQMRKDCIAKREAYKKIDEAEEKGRMHHIGQIVSQLNAIEFEHDRNIGSLRKKGGR